MAEDKPCHTLDVVILGAVGGMHAEKDGSTIINLELGQNRDSNG
ncbi:MAG: hypothetical protein QW520_02625 [Methanomassiliicoccales archaeon]